MRVAAYIRVSDASQVEGHSLDAQERLIRELCDQRGWDLVRVYREEGKSAHTDRIAKRAQFQCILTDAKERLFDAVMVHTLDRWSRNLKILLESVGILADAGVGLVSVTENIDWATPHGRFVGQTLGGVAELYSGMLATHVKKGVGERARKGLHLGSIPFAYQGCKATRNESRQPCDQPHPGGLHQVQGEAAAVRSLFERYATGTATLSILAAAMNGQGFRTRAGNLFTTASVRGILHNVFFTGKVRHRETVRPGLHEALIADDLFQAVQDALRRNNGRSATLSRRPQRSYLLKGLVRCAYCDGHMWAQTINNGRPYYREEVRSRANAVCIADGKSVACAVPDGQIDEIIKAIVLPDAWLDRVLAQVHGQDEVQRIADERRGVNDRLRRLGRAYVDGLYDDGSYRREKHRLEDQLAALVIPGIDAAKEAGRMLDDLPQLWAGATLAERHELLATMLDAVYIDPVDARAVVAIRPKPAFRALLELAVMWAESKLALVIQEADAEKPPFDGSQCFWWRRGRVELPVQRWSRVERYRLSRSFVSRRSRPRPTGSSAASR